ncbi:hypothetical protein D3C81_1900920 [compost metagenome]
MMVELLVQHSQQTYRLRLKTRFLGNLLNRYFPWRQSDIAPASRERPTAIQLFTDQQNLLFTENHTVNIYLRSSVALLTRKGKSDLLLALKGIVRQNIHTELPQRLITFNIIYVLGVCKPRLGNRLNFLGPG